MTFNPQPKKGKKRKNKRQTDEAYLDFIRAQPCIISGRPAIAHHEDISKSGGMAYKCSDRYAIPLAPDLHTERHQIGRYTFAKKYNIDYIKEISNLQKKWFSFDK